METIIYDMILFKVADFTEKYDLKVEIWALIFQYLKGWISAIPFSVKDFIIMNSTLMSRIS